MIQESLQPDGVQVDILGEGQSGVRPQHVPLAQLCQVPQYGLHLLHRTKGNTPASVGPEEGELYLDEVQPVQPHSQGPQDVESETPAKWRILEMWNFRCHLWKAVISVSVKSNSASLSRQQRQISLMSWAENSKVRWSIFIPTSFARLADSP